MTTIWGFDGWRVIITVVGVIAMGVGAFLWATMRKGVRP